ncbi:uncharacterized protein LOC144138973 [Haemaphysalis longicornis]
MWIVQVSAVSVTLAMTASVAMVCFLSEAGWRTQEHSSVALELDVEGARGASKNNSTDAISGVAIPSIYKFTTKSTIPGNSSKAPKLTAEKQRKVATSNVAAPASVRSEPGKPSTHQHFPSPHLGKSPGNTTSEYNVPTAAGKRNGLSSTWYGLSVKDGKDPNPGLSRKTG